MILCNGLKLQWPILLFYIHHVCPGDYNEERCGRTTWSSWGDVTYNLFRPTVLVNVGLGNLNLNECNRSCGGMTISAFEISPAEVSFSIAIRQGIQDLPCIDALTAIHLRVQASKNACWRSFWLSYRLKFWWPHQILCCKLLRKNLVVWLGRGQSDVADETTSCCTLPHARCVLGKVKHKLVLFKSKCSRSIGPWVLARAGLWRRGIAQSTEGSRIDFSLQERVHQTMRAVRVVIEMECTGRCLPWKIGQSRLLHC